VAASSLEGPTIVGRYVLLGEVASGGMATIYYGRRQDEPPPGTMVAVKRVHPHLARDRRFASMFIDEARLVSRIHHPNVIRTLDITASEDECLLVMEYIHGDSLGRLLRASEERGLTPGLGLLSSILCGALEGLHASHEATNAAGVPLDLVHRDISPQNVMVGADGVARVLDFGVAKAAGSMHVTRDGEIKGKIAYMSPEQVSARPLDRRTDVYAAGVVLWEAVTGRPLFDGESDVALITAVLRQEIPVPSSLVPGLPPALDAVILRALAAEREDRFGTAREMAVALDAIVPRADTRDVAAWVDAVAGDDLRARHDRMQRGADVGGAGGPPAASPTGATEVFFTRRSGGAAPTSEKASAVLERGLTSIEAGMTDVTRRLPERVRGPAHRYRWWLAGACGLFAVTLGYCVFAPPPPQQGGISAAPDGVSPPKR